MNASYFFLALIPISLLGCLIYFRVTGKKIFGVPKNYKHFER